MNGDFSDRVHEIVLPEMPAGWRNHLINATYHDMAVALDGMLGSSRDLTWPHFAKWTSFTVGFNFRFNDPPLTVEQARELPRMQRAGHAARRSPGKMWGYVKRVPWPRPFMQWLLRLYLRTIKGFGARVFGRSMSLANRGVCFELGGAMADFIDTFRNPPDDPAESDALLDQVVARARARPDPPGERWAEADRDLLEAGLRAYHEALSLPEGRDRSERILYGTISLTEFEQQRLETWLRLSLLSPHLMVRDYFRRFLALGRCWKPGEIGPPRAFGRVVARIVTALFVAVRVPGEVVRASRNLRNPGGEAAFFAVDLEALRYPPLLATIRRYDAELGLTRRDGTATRVWTWTDLDRRMRFINTWFRSRQQVASLTAPPYTEAELEALERHQARVAGTRAPARIPDPRPAMAVVPAPWTDAAMNGLRKVGDPDVDQLLDGVFDGRPLGGDDVTAALRCLLVDPPPEVVDFKAAPGPRPPWAQDGAMGPGQAFYDKWRFQLSMGLLFASLPGTYAAEMGVQVLAIASQLTKDPRRRVLETARYLESAMTTDVLQPATTGFLESKNVRLLHGLVRRMVREATAPPPATAGAAAAGRLNRFWDKSWGEPANQEDGLGTLLAFAVKPLEFLDVVGVSYTDAEADAFVHAWCCAGLELGIRPDLLTSPADPARPLSYREAKDLMRIIEHRHLRPNWAGQWLTASLLEVLECMVVTVSLPRAFIRVGASPGVAEMMGVPRSRIFEFLLTAVHGFFRNKRGFWLVSWFYRLVARFLSRRLRRKIDRDPDANRAAFRERGAAGVTSPSPPASLARSGPTPPPPPG